MRMLHDPTTALFSLVVLQTVFLSGCAIDAKGLQTEVAHLQRTGPRVNRFHDLGQRVRCFSEETVTQAYISAESPDERIALLDIIGWSGLGDGRFFPLLFYVVQFSESSAERAAAARLMADLKEPPGPFRKSSIIWVIGEALAREEQTDAANVLAYSLKTFLQGACSYEISDSESVIRRAPIFGNIRIHRVDTEVMRSWWKKTGRRLTKEGRFDGPPSSQPS
jgi:hypothetical protein